MLRPGARVSQLLTRAVESAKSPSAGAWASLRVAVSGCGCGYLAIPARP